MKCSFCASRGHVGCNMLSYQPMESFRPRLFFDARPHNFDCFVVKSLGHWTLNTAAWASISFRCFWIWFRYSVRGLLDFASFTPVRGFSLEAGLKVLISFVWFAGPCFCLVEDQTSQGACSVLSYLNQHFENWKTGSTLPCPPLSCGSLPLASHTACGPSSSWSYLVITHYYDTVPSSLLNFLEIFLEIARRSSSHLCCTPSALILLSTQSP